MKDSSMDKYDDLQIALNVARDNLKSLTAKMGREEFRDTRKRPHWDRDNGNGHHKSFDEPEIKRSGNPFNVGGGGGGGGPGGKRPRNNVFSRLEPRSQAKRSDHTHRDNHSGPSPPKPKLSSRVTKEMPRREDVVAAQSDEQSRARNKRMFGSLLGTLNKFCQDESRLRGRVEKKAIIEKKVEEQELREKETSKIQRRNLFVDRKKQMMEVRLLEIKMERMQDFSAWEEAQKKTREFIRTAAGPKIFFKPKVMNEKSTQLLQESQRQYDEELEKKRQEMQQGLVEVEERLKRELEKALEEKPNKEEAQQQQQREEGFNKRLGTGDRDRNGDSDHDSEGEQPPNRQQQQQRIVVARHSKREIEELEEGEHPDDDDEDDVDEGEEEEDEVEAPRPRLVSQVVKSQVGVSMKKNMQRDRRHVLQSAVNRKMIISVVNNAYEGGRRF